MNIIAGAGKIDSSLTHPFSFEEHNLTMIDSPEAVPCEATERHLRVTGGRI